MNKYIKVKQITESNKKNPQLKQTMYINMNIKLLKLKVADKDQ